MKFIKLISILLCYSWMVFAQGSVVFLGSASLVPKNLNTCNLATDPGIQTQTATYSWEVHNCNGIATASGSVSIAGTGYCSGLGYWCPVIVNGYQGATAPFFQPGYTVAAGNTQFSIYATAISIKDGGSLTFGYGCGNTSTTSTTPPLMSNIPTCSHASGSPIVIDTNGEGFHLTNLNNGVKFRTTLNSTQVQMAWTDPNYHNGWLALPRDGKVEALSDLFGNFTSQPPSSDPNGYLALAVYDENKDGVIDSSDAIYGQLRIWIDANHDGIAQTAELHTLPEMELKVISLSYKSSPFVDPFGNQFRYAAQIVDAKSPRDKRCFDVFLEMQF